MTESEIWKDVAEYEGLYKVSNKGNIYSIGRKDSRGHRRRGRMLSPGHNSHSGYPQVGLRKNGVLKMKYIHRLVAETFLPNPEGRPQVNHRDEDKVNNNVENLEWCTSEYNNTYGTRIEKVVQARSKKVKATNIKTNEVITFNSTQEAKLKGFSGGCVSAACRGVYKGRAGKLVGGDGRTYKGYKWYYEEELK